MAQKFQCENITPHFDIVIKMGMKNKQHGINFEVTT
jgi:hypothetical protein